MEIETKLHRIMLLFVPKSSESRPPLPPTLGAAAAFGFSRKLRMRIKANKA